ncbi:hypothetical protein IEM_00959 [Bacillus cereus BAG6O-2]|nr:hypothetical protein IEM_00959 [Bacillus cereus BAG6O-2]
MSGMSCVTTRGERRVLTFLFELDKDIPQKDEPRYVAYAKGFIEGDLTICVGDRVLFQKSCMKVVELGIYLGQWMEQVQHGQNVHVNYETIDDDEVILGFFYEEDNQWRNSSSWQEFELQERISTITLVESVQRYLYGLNKELCVIEYPVTFDQYLRGERIMQLSYKRLCDSKADTMPIEVYNGSKQAGSTGLL